MSSTTTPLWAVLLFTFNNSIGSAVLNSGIYFLAQNRFGFGERENFALGLLYGVTYIPAALAVGPLLRRLPAGSRWANPRGTLVLIMLLLALACMVPVWFQRPWTVWVLLGLCSPLSGMLWPITESYVSGGRSGTGLRTAIGRFNVAWSSALVIALLAMSPFVRRQPLDVLAALAIVQVLTTLVLAWFGARPGAHGNADAEPHPAVYTQLLNFVRVLLPVAFMFLSALAPYLPRVGSRMGFSPEWSATLPAGWMAWRVVTFFALERWHGWHGRWWTPMLGVASLLVGFGIVVLTPTIVGPGTVGVGLLLAGLGVFGVGVGIIYCAALYYAMEVGAAEVDAGGTHEMLIGVGYSVGPACGLAGLAVTGTVALGSEQIMLVLVSVLALLATSAAMSQAQRAARQRRGEPTSTTARAA